MQKSMAVLLVETITEQTELRALLMEGFEPVESPLSTCAVFVQHGSALDVLEAVMRAVLVGKISAATLAGTGTFNFQGEDSSLGLYIY